MIFGPLFYFEGMVRLCQKGHFLVVFLSLPICLNEEQAVYVPFEAVYHYFIQLLCSELVLVTRPFAVVLPTVHLTFCIQ